MATKLNSVDVLIVGLGWTGGIIAKELASTGLQDRALERGGPRDTNPDFLDPQIHDELRYAARHDLMQNVERETLTFRNNASQTALPMRQLGSFLPGQGVGGAGVHWNGVTWRWLEWDHQARNRTVDKYGERSFPTDMHLQDWPIAYDDLEPYYDKFEKTCGTSGKAGNLNGQKIDGGNIFEGPRKSEYPNPPLIAAAEHGDVREGGAQSRLPSLPQPRRRTLRRLCQPRWRAPSANVTIAASASASAARRTPRRARTSPSFRWRCRTRTSSCARNSTVLKVNLDSTGKKARQRHLSRRARPRVRAARRSHHPCRPMRSGTCTCCCIPESASPMTRRRARAWSAATTPIRPAAEQPPSSTRRRSQSLHGRRRARHLHG